MLTTITQLIQKIKFWLRLAILLHGPLKENLLRILHNKHDDPTYKGLPEDPSELYNELSTTHRQKLNKLVNDKVLNKNDLEILLPTNGDKKTDSSQFDVTLIIKLIINCTTLQPPSNGWKEKPTNDPSVAASVILGKHWRNFLNHTDAYSIDQALFDVKWNEGVAIVQGLGGDIKEMTTLKTASLDPKQEVMALSLMEFNRLEVDKLRKRICVIESTTDGIDKQGQKTTVEVQKISSEILQIAGEAQQFDGEVQQLQQRFDQQAQQIYEETQEINIMIANHNMMLNQLKDIEREMNTLRTKFNENFKPNEGIDIKHACCKDVLIYVAEELNNDWQQFLMILTNDRNLIEEMKTNGKSGKENVMEFFRTIAFQLKWSDLKQNLYAMEKGSIVDHIEKNFLYTQALQLASNKLKQHYIEEMIECIIDQPFNLNSSGGTNPLSREQAYVDLAVLTGEQVDIKWNNSDREAIMAMKHLKMKSININDIWLPTDQFVVIRGIAGIGKSTLIQRYVLKWAKDEIVNKNNNNNNNDQRIDFLFFFKCRELNTMPNIKSFEELLKVKYPELFKFIDLSDLQNIADRIMIIVDGLDELQGVYKKEGQFNITEMVKKTIDPKSNILKGHKTIIGGRHNACESIMLKVTETSIKIVEVCGFSEAKSIEYIENFFGSDVQRADKVKKIIKQPKVRVMSNVPFLLWIICLLFSKDFKEEINTITELYVYGLFAFLKNHFNCQEKTSDIGLYSFVTSKHFGEIVYSLSILSVKTYMNNEVIFTDNDIKAVGCDLRIQNTGLVDKHTIGKFGCQAYQFKHFVFQEFLCSLHLCLTKGVSQYKTNHELSSCTSTILGIYHLVETAKNQLFLAFYQNMEIVHHRNSKTLNEYINKPLRQFGYNKFIQQHKQLIHKCFEKNTFVIKFYPYTMLELMRNIKENDWLVDKETAEKIRNSEIKVNSDSNSSLVILEFLQSLEIVRINYISLATDKFTEADWDLFRMAEKDPLLEIDFRTKKYFFDRYYTYAKHPLGSFLSLDHKEKFVVPDHMKLSFNKFNVLISGEEELENILFPLNDLIEHVLENHGKKKLVLQIQVDSLYGALLKKIRIRFGRREHFENIVFEKDLCLDTNALMMMSLFNIRRVSRKD